MQLLHSNKLAYRRKIMFVSMIDLQIIDYLDLDQELWARLGPYFL
jgi:hypothetical protein